MMLIGKPGTYQTFLRLKVVSPTTMLHVPTAAAGKVDAPALTTYPSGFNVGLKLALVGSLMACVSEPLSYIHMSSRILLFRVLKTSLMSMREIMLVRPNDFGVPLLLLVLRCTSIANGSLSTSALNLVYEGLFSMYLMKWSKALCCSGVRSLCVGR